MAQKKTSHASARKKAVGIGVGVTAAMVAAAGAYFLYGSKNAEKNRKQVKSWMLKAKAQVLEGIENTADLSKESYDKLVDSAVAGYGKLKSVSGKELEALRRELKAHWKELEKTGKTSLAGKGARAKTKKKPAKASGTKKRTRTGK